MATPKAKSLTILIIFQALLMLLAGHLISRMSWIGRQAISWFYKEYGIFKSAIGTAILFFAIQMILLFLQWLINKRYDRRIANIVSWILMVVALVGLYATYNDFQDTLSHKILNEKFHVGFYLFWLGWISTCVYFIYGVRHTPPPFNVPEV